MNLSTAECLETNASWWDHHGMPILILCLFGLAITDRFLAGLRGRTAIDPQNDDYADPPNDVNSGASDER
jgi:hypothetical protein